MTHRAEGARGTPQVRQDVTGASSARMDADDALGVTSDDLGGNAASGVPPGRPQVTQDAPDAPLDTSPALDDTTPHKRSWVRMRTIFGESVMPPDSAAVVMRAVNRAVAVGDAPRNARWMIVELWAADYLANEHALARWRELQGAQPPTQGDNQ